MPKSLMFSCAKTFCSSERLILFLNSLIIIVCLLFIAYLCKYIIWCTPNWIYGNQNNGWKLVGHLFRIGTLLQTINGSPLEMYSKFVLPN